MELNNKEKIKEIVERYPYLLPRNVWTDKVPEDYDYTYIKGLEIPAGWRRLFFQMCEDIRQPLIDADYLDKFRFSQIKEKYNCYDDQTEVLTKNGWKFFKDVNYEDQIATLDDDNNLVYQYPTEIMNYDYSGQMYYIENRGVSLCVTPNHNLYVAKGSYYNWRKGNEKRIYPFELTTPATYFQKDKRFLKGCNWNGHIDKKAFRIPDYTYTNSHSVNGAKRTYTITGKDIDLEKFLKFLGFYIAEGHVRIKKDGCRGEISVAYNPSDEEELVVSLIKDIGFNCHLSQNHCAKFSYSPLANWLVDNCGHLAPNKRVPDFIKDLPSKYIEIFLTYLYIGDGHKNPTSNILATSSKQLCDDVCELLLKCNSSFSYIRQYNTHKKPHMINGKMINSNYDLYCINWLKNIEVEFDTSKIRRGLCPNTKEEYVDYKGKVYCCTVPNHIVYVRRNGKGVWCGNSLRCYHFGAPEEVCNIIRKYEQMAYYVCTKCGKPATYETQGYFASYCDDCFKDLVRHQGVEPIEFRPYFKISGHKNGEDYEKIVSFEDEWNRYIKGE